ncbi:unnamed protein product [Euphydryas editha]|uniref:Uncharacterized protein n=1 Tax=Euphydryas editha TaxID=104508 RepID=A0AAU9TNU9_EUPED|nr:unnamed protein product [Euphydryas editha]
MLVNFLKLEELFLMNSFFKKKLQRRWTWQKLDTVTRKEKGFIMVNKRHIFKDVFVINKFSTGSEYRQLRGTLIICLRKERTRLMKSTLQSTALQILYSSEQIQRELHSRLDSLKTTSNVDEIIDNVVKTVYTDNFHRQNGYR